MPATTAPNLIPEGAPLSHGRLSRPVAFGATSAILVLFAAASSAPSPLYVVYQEQWRFSPTTLTIVFAVYVVGLLGSLLVLGALSDHIGRRPVLAAAIGLEAVALALFIAAGDVTALAIARVAQGVATGIAFTTLGATLMTSIRRTRPAAPAWSTASHRSADWPSARWGAGRSCSSRPRRPISSTPCCSPAWSSPR